MNISLNLATRPYIELRSVYARLRVFAVALAALALPMLLVVHLEESKARLAEARVDQLESNIAMLRRQQANAQAIATQGPNANVVTEAAFLNSLFRRKAFSWTATMSDLEDTLPYGVQVNTIDPVVAPDGHVTIRMRVIAARERGIEVVRNLEHSRHFAAPRLASEALATQGNNAAPQARTVPTAGGSLPTDVSFDILADYRPLPNSHDHATLRAYRANPANNVAPAATPAQAAMPQLTNPDPATARPPMQRPQSPFLRAQPGTPAAAAVEMRGH